MASTPTRDFSLLNQSEAAQILGIQPRTLENWRARRIGPSFLAISRRCVRYRLVDLEAWLNGKTIAIKENRE